MRDSHRTFVHTCRAAVEEPCMTAVLQRCTGGDRYLCRTSCVGVKARLSCTVQMYKVHSTRQQHAHCEPPVP